MLKIRNINFSYGKKNKVEALKSVSLDVDFGEIVTIVGKSGSGKSTLLKVVAGYLIPEAGEVILDGVNITSLSQNDCIKFCTERMGFIWQDFQLIQDMSARDNIILPSYIHNKNFDKKYFTSLIELLGIKERLNHYPNQLSGGEQQRCAIARALLLKPKIVLADEPTGSLDSINSQAIIDIIKTANQKFGQTFIIATHDTYISNLGNKVIRMSDGRIL